MDIPAPGVGAVCGPCPDGFTGGDTKCYGMSKVAEVISLHICVPCPACVNKNNCPFTANTNLSPHWAFQDPILPKQHWLMIFYCGDADINECVQNTTICQQLCINTDGSYTCACINGYQLVEGINQCRGTDMIEIDHVHNFMLQYFLQVMFKQFPRYCKFSATTYIIFNDLYRYQ